MQFGLNENGDRIKAKETGQRAKCPYCGGVLISKCGEHYINHWQHSRDKDCDPWAEHETEWHLKWKSKFPESWREVVMHNFGEKHIADIQTPSGLVIEFQNSSISSDTIRIRENFYQNMIWVINALPFKSNFDIRSVVNSKLRMLESNSDYEITRNENAFNDEIKRLNNEINKNEQDSKNKSHSISYYEGQVEKLRQLKESTDKFAHSVIKHWMNNEYFYESLTNEITRNIDSKIKAELIQIPISIDKSQSQMEEYGQRISEIVNFKDFEYQHTIYKIIPYERVDSKNYKNKIAILKETKDSFFPNIHHFNSEQELKNFLFRHNNYDFAFDPSGTLESLDGNISAERAAIGELSERLIELTKIISDQIHQNILERIAEIENALRNLNLELKRTLTQTTNLIAKRNEITKNHPIEIQKMKEKIERDVKNERKYIMAGNKGVYSYKWNHERKSWTAANCEIYFDFGDHLFKVIKEGVFKKIGTKEFLSTHLIDTT